jgi:Zn-dependent M28 family amino/carboxypeptidase
MDVWLEAKLDEARTDTITAPNVVAILEGTDSTLSGQYVAFTAHMDHTGLRRGQSDSINNGADDNASGVAGLLELARAFSQPGARPRRSLVFLVVSGGAKDFWGSKFLVKNPPVGLQQIVTNVNLDMIGRQTGDSITVNGLRDLEFEKPPSWVVAEHPELRLTLADGGSAANLASDHSPFVRAIVPSLYIHSGDHGDELSMPDLPTAIDTEQESRILRLVFYMGQAIANAEKRPAWTSEGRRQRLEMLGP